MFYTICKDEKNNEATSFIYKFINNSITGYHIETKGGGNEVINTAELSPDDSKIICGTKKGFVIYDAKEIKCIKEFKVRESVSIVVASDEFVIFLEGANRINKVFFYEQKICDFEIEKIDMMKISVEHTKVFTYNYSTSVFKIFLTEDFTELVKLTIPDLVEIHSHPQESHFIVLTKEAVICYSSETFTRVFKIKCITECKNLAINQTENKLFIYSNKILNPQNIDLRINNIGNHYIIGTPSLISKFDVYLKDFIEGKIKDRNPEMEDFLIMPFHRNMVHYYAKYNKYDFLAEALSEGSGYIKSD